MRLSISYNSTKLDPTIELPASKSISNRLLIAQAISDNQFEILDLSEAKDTVVLQRALQANQSNIDVGLAGTAYRFLTAYYAIQNGGSI